MFCDTLYKSGAAVRTVQIYEGSVLFLKCSCLHPDIRGSESPPPPRMVVRRECWSHIDMANVHSRTYFISICKQDLPLSDGGT